MTELPHPRTALDLRGHDAAERRFLDAYNSGRLPHGWLISGPRGIGKASLAYRIARFLLNEDGGGGLFGAPDSLDAPIDCAAARQIAAGSHPGLLAIERGLNDKTGKMRGEIVVDDIREINHFMSMTSSGGWRVAIVDSADEMNPNAANALLKILEEPPQNAILLLIAHAPGRLLPTIRSRCRNLALTAPPQAEVAAILSHFFPELNPADMPRLAALAEHSPGRALALAAGEGLALYDRLCGHLAELPRLDILQLQKFAAYLAAEERWPLFGDLLGAWFTRAMRHAAGAETPGSNDDERAAFARIGGRLDRWFEVWDKVSRLLDRTDAVHLDKKQITMTIFAALAKAA